MSRRIIGPFNRVEGDLEVRIDIDGGQVTDAHVVSPLYRGFEQILHGKDPRDALVYAPRICGICSVSQSVAAARALASIQDITPPLNGQYAQNLVLAAENIADHLTHFYLFFMPDFARGIYAAEPWFGKIKARFKAVKGTAAKGFLPARARWLHIMGLMAGKWPHSLAIQPGGLTKVVDVSEKMRLMAILSDFRSFLETVVFGDELETMTSLSNRAELASWAERAGSRNSDFSSFLEISKSLNLESVGHWQNSRFLSYGGYDFDDGPLFAPGLYSGGDVTACAQGEISEDGSHSWLALTDGPKHPFIGTTIPDADAARGYSWCKAPRYMGQPAEMGALARQLADRQPLLTDLAARGGSVYSRVVARLIEVARILPAMEQWAESLEPGKPFYFQPPMPSEGEGYGLVEAARGGLGHWVRIRNNCILNYQIIAPTTWNFSPRDRDGVPGPLEQALVGAPVREGETDPVAVQHIVRSFDPCMVCTVH